MDASDLRIFEAVARHGGMNRAAEKLNTVQSNVTTRIQNLEEELGVPLFKRHSRGAALTPAGQRLLPYAQRPRCSSSSPQHNQPGEIDDKHPCLRSARNRASGIPGWNGRPYLRVLTAAIALPLPYISALKLRASISENKIGMWKYDQSPRCLNKSKSWTLPI